MAAATSDWDDIDENFLQCPICLDQLHEPKQLTCLHRFCSGCLEKVLQECLGVIKCPECREEIAVPEDGVVGFKTDFHLKNIIEFIRLKKSLVENNEAQECYSCSKREQVSAYCLKCSGFLCKACHQFHRTSKITKDHLTSILDLKDPAIHKLGIAKLSQLVDSPRCLKHPENIMRLCCATCSYDHICVTCVHGDHVGHDTKDIHTMAQVNTANLKDNIALLRGCKDNIYKLRQAVKSVARNTDSFSGKRISMLEECHMHQENLLEILRKRIFLKRDNQIREIDNKHEKKIGELTTKMEKEIEQVRARYAVKFKEQDDKHDNFLEKVEAQSKDELQVLEKQRQKANKCFRDSEKTLQTFREEADERFTAASEHSENIIKRYENLIATASSILAADNDWTAVRCIPDICSAVTPLIEDMTNTFTELTKISQSPPSEVLLPVDVTAFQVSCHTTFIDIQCTDRGEDPIVGLVDVPGEGVIITRQVGSKFGYSQCIDIQGKVLWGDFPERFFGIPQSDIEVYKMKAAVRCFPGAITTLGRRTRRRSLWGVHLNEMIDFWPTDRLLHCVAADPLNKHVFAGFRDCRDIHVYSDTLRHVGTFSLPPKIKYPSSLAVSVEGLLIVCDASGKRVISVNMKGELVSTYFLPSLGEGIPRCACTDSKDNVYVLLSVDNFTSAVVQYCQTGGHPVSSLHVFGDMFHLTVTRDKQGEKLLVGGSSGNTLFVYPTMESHKVEERTPVARSFIQDQGLDS
ncbi:E3 ubiquitin-protein ligase TRIM56 [Holothuria leucospilota]|uniref:E3 ubiquitin-protein ligase TRIM56 n=1 Tax=Holothuria leucospilota TaxID=206669 RepID=A0A9Q1C8M6_HOLLE|nr:E3 ubiquitin-protein ligase TRIM56 [Holothuria leucospilota]